MAVAPEWGLAPITNSDPPHISGPPLDPRAEFQIQRASVVSLDHNMNGRGGLLRNGGRWW